MKISLLLLLTLTSMQLFALPEPRDEGEALFVRRILEFWKDKEYAFAKTQIEAFQKEYPNSPFQDQFYTMLGDVAMHEKNYDEAVQHYDKISSYTLRTSLRQKKWQALYQQKNYAALYQEIAPIRDCVDEEGEFYFAEAAFREGLKLCQDNGNNRKSEVLFREALPTYKRIQNHTTFGPHAKLAMAEMHRLLGEVESAANLYLEIAEEGEKQEEILFHAAGMLAQFDTCKALEIFEELTREGTKRAPDAAFHWLQMLAKEERWGEIAHERRLLLSRLAPEHLPVAYFYLGMIASERGKHHQAILDLTKCIEGKVQIEQALLTLMKSARELGEIDISEKFFSLAKKEIPEALPGLKLIRAETYAQAGNTAKALEFYNETIVAYPSTKEAEHASVKKMRLLIEQGDWREARETALKVLEDFPNSQKREEVLRLTIDLSLSQAVEGEGFASLAEDLEKAFTYDLFQGEELLQKQHLLAKTYLKLGRPESALEVLYASKTPDHLLLTQCYLMDGSSPDQVVYHGEKALSQDPTQENLHLHLFNAYRDLAKSHPSEEMSARAAEHLDRVIDHCPISIENHLWLAHYYVRQRQPRAISLLEALFQTEANFHRLDTEAILLASLHHEYGETTTALCLLEKLIGMNTPHKPRAELFYAQISQKEGEESMARSLYQHLEKSQDIRVAYTARLELARLQFQEQPERSLRTLHELKMRKTLANEPVHLEAALDHADFSASLLAEKKRPEYLRELLLDIKREFTEQTDIWSKDYHTSRNMMPAQESLYQAYMRYLDARLYVVDALLTKDRHEKKAKLQAAQNLFSSLSQGKYALTPYLVEKATEGVRND